jgi:aspartate racemase
MKPIGLIGGTSWLSTIDYYRGINTLVNEKLGRLNSAKIIMYSLNMEEFYNLGTTQGWDKAGEFLSGIAKKLEAAGAEALLMCANTPHITAPAVQKSITIPLIHIVEETAKEIKRQGFNKVALLGTTITMENGFYQEILLKHGIGSVIPEAEERNFIQHSIFAELGRNIFKPDTRKRYLEIIEKLREQGAQGVILGCTEIPLLLKPEDISIPSFDTTMIHVRAAVDFILAD